MNNWTWYMKFVALISGGKDSFFNIHHCLSQGHELVALGNLYPKSSEKDEIDSFMFQTVGHDLIEYYGQCLEVPLYRQCIKGKSKNQKLEYSVTEDDEIEDLFRLLSHIKSIHGEIEGVSCGAILSHYQRTRVENVCGRLGLTSLAFLWQRNQLELMQEMCSSRLDARIIKVAAIGLSTQHLGKSIQELFPYLVKLNSMYDVHICGEGGEFETIVLDSSFFKQKRLQIVDQEIVKHSNDDVSYLKLKVELDDKEYDGFLKLSQPSLLTEEFNEIYGELEKCKGKLQIEPEKESREIVEEEVHETSIISTSTKLYISNLVSLNRSSVKEQAIDIFSRLKEILSSNNLTLNNIQHITLLLSDISQFNEINGIYSKSFEEFYLPPSRICIETKLNSRNLIQLSCIVLKDHGFKRGIHIRSRSYWAPQNIGPYSQSLIEERTSYKLATLSGQIPLVPSTMEMSQLGTIFDCILSLQHLFRVKSLIDVNKIGHIICFITNDNDVPIVCKTWQLYVNSLEDSNCLKQLIITKVSNLPKNAEVEWSGLSFENIIGMYDDDDDDENNQLSGQTDKLMRSFDDYSVITIGRGKFKIVVLFTNDLEKVKGLIKHNANKNYLQILTTNKNINKLINQSFKNVEFLPVLNNFNCIGNRYTFSIIWKIED